MYDMGCKSSQPINYDTVELGHFELLRCIGKGTFGKVRIVKHKQNGELFALKYINKKVCIKMDASSNVIKEREILGSINYKHICNLRYAFQDDENLFMVLDLMLGGDMRFHLDSMVCMPEELVKFYTAVISICLKFLHNLGIVHRDIKPDNILLCKNGYPHISDFNVATLSHVITTTAGSRAYMAPEIKAKKEYNSAVDYWSLGVCAFEMVNGQRPFEACDVLYFNENLSSECTDFIRKLLDFNPQRRLQGDSVQNHPWLVELDWQMIDSKQYVPCFIPDSSKNNFYATHELEEILITDNPLRAQSRKVFVPGKKIPLLSTQMIKFEYQFPNFDPNTPLTPLPRSQKYNSTFVGQVDGGDPDISAPFNGKLIMPPDMRPNRILKAQFNE